MTTTTTADKPLAKVELPPERLIAVQKAGVYQEWTVDLPDSVVKQLRLGASLWNSLVASYEERESDKLKIWSSYPNVAKVEQRIAERVSVEEELAQQVANARKEQGTKKPNHPGVKALAAVRKDIRALKAERRKCISGHSDDAKPRLEEATRAFYARNKELYAVFVANGGYWATYNDMSLRRLGPAMKRVRDARKEGRPATLREHGWTGGGTMTVQPQRQTGKPARTPDVIANSETGKYRNVLHVPRIPPDEWEAMSRAQRKVAGRVGIRMRIGSDENGEPQHLVIPVQIHRQLPDDADITEARFTVRRRGPDFVAQVTVIAWVPSPAPKTRGPMTALHLGWGEHPDGIQVAHWASTRPIAVPHHWRHVVRVTGRSGREGVIVVPNSALERLERVDRVRSLRDREINRLKDELMAWIDEHEPLPNPFADGEGEEPVVTSARLRLWRSPSRFAALRRELLPHKADPHYAVPLRLLSAWHAADRDHWAAGERQRAHILGFRDDLLRNVAHILGTHSTVLVTDNTSIADLSRHKPDDGEAEGIPEKALERAARRRVVGAPGSLREWCRQTTQREGGTLVEVSAAGLTQEHDECGHVHKPRTVRGPEWTCQGCGETYDVDRSSLMLMMRRADNALDTTDGAPRITG